MGTELHNKSIHVLSPSGQYQNKVASCDDIGVSALLGSDMCDCIITLTFMDGLCTCVITSVFIMNATIFFLFTSNTRT